MERNTSKKKVRFHAISHKKGILSLFVNLLLLIRGGGGQERSNVLAQNNSTKNRFPLFHGFFPSGIEKDSF